METLKHKRRPLPPEWDADRADLCACVDFPSMLAADGVEVKRNGRAFVCAMRPERTPSCHVYPPGVGRKGAAGWTWWDYGAGAGGDVLGYLLDVRGLPWDTALADLCRLAGKMPPYMAEHLGEAQGNRVGCPTRAYIEPARPLDRGENTPQGPPPEMPHDEQWLAVGGFLAALLDLDPNAAGAGADYLAARGVLHEAGNVHAYRLRADLVRTLADRLGADAEADLFKRAGLLRTDEGKPPRLCWWGETVLLLCHDPEACAAYLVGRRLDWKAGDRAGKYINQPCAGGAVRWPFNLPALYHAAGRLPDWPHKTDRRDVLLVEGPLDALGAACLGWPAVALLNRPQAHNYADRHGAAARMLEAHLPALRDAGRVLVVPDADAGGKEAEGVALAARLVGWLRFAGVGAEVRTLRDLCPAAPEGCKDLADVAKAKDNPARIEPLPAGLAYGATVPAAETLPEGKTP